MKPVRKRRKRCPVCKKIRMWWKKSHHVKPATVQKGKLRDGRKACWVCVTREMEAGTTNFKEWKPVHDKLQTVREVLED